MRDRSPPMSWVAAALPKLVQAVANRTPWRFATDEPEALSRRATASNRGQRPAPSFCFNDEDAVPTTLCADCQRLVLAKTVAARASADRTIRHGDLPMRSTTTAGTGPRPSGCAISCPTRPTNCCRADFATVESEPFAIADTPIDEADLIPATRLFAKPHRRNLASRPQPGAAPPLFPPAGHGRRRHTTLPTIAGAASPSTPRWR